jgi:hypothetical protein
MASAEGQVISSDPRDWPSDGILRAPQRQGGSRMQQAAILQKMAGFYLL